jgi:DNA polymerase elongation subunit (family B)|tara:strand:- start:1003 stop:3771 length:2769 start_codon:yes stop_codon:yes gene_type:complete
MIKEIISQEVIEEFLNGSDPEKYIVGIEYEYKTNTIYKIIQDPEKGKIIRKDTLTPFLWVNDISSLNFYGRDKARQRKKMIEYGIKIEKLEDKGHQRLMEGYNYIVKSTKGYGPLLDFFRQGGINPWDEDVRNHFILLNPKEQFLIQKEKRLFKGLEDYDDVHRLVFDIETTGLDPEVDKIILIGMKDNRDFVQIIDAFGEDGEARCIIEFFKHLRELKPTTIAGYNSSFFDFPFILKRCEILGINPKEHTQIFHAQGIKEREGMLKLANEVEYYTQHIIWGMNILDIAHSVRRSQAINSDIKSWGLKYITKYLGAEKKNRVYVEGSQISNIYIDNESFYMNPETGKYKKIGSPGTENLLERFPNVYEVWTGRKIVEQYLEDDLYETMVVDDSFSQSTFLLSKVVPATYERVSTMGTATLWKLIMLAWSYKHDLAVPKKDERRPITGGLSRLLNVGYETNVVKFDYSSLYPSIQLVYDVFPDCDVMGVQKSMLKYFRDVRINYKLLAAEHYKTDPELSEKYNRKQLPIKIFINAYFGSLSAPHVFPWGDMDMGETITCVGRQSLRMMIMYFQGIGYKPLVMDTDGVNFSAPEDMESRKYIGKGLNGLVVKDKEYEGLEADTAEFNDIFMRGEMGLDIDYVCPATINLARKNYVLKKPNGGVKLTGNTIKSKNLSGYIVDFLDKGLRLLLDGKGHEFIEYYYSYIEIIYKQEIPLAKIANKSRVKQSIDDYKKHIQKRTKSGSLMSRKAHMELIMVNGYNAGLGETIFYVNNGTAKSHGDVSKKPKTDEVRINCYMITEKEMSDNPEMKGEYNIARYVNTFNKRIEPLMVVFSPDIRNDIMVDNPEKRQYFTPAQCKLDSGNPMKEGGQDNFDDVMTLSETEVIFWNKIKRDPFFLYLDDSLKHIDQHWVKHNRSLLDFEIEE